MTRVMEHLGLELSDKKGGCQLGQLGEEIEILGLGYVHEKDSLRILVPEDRVEDLGKKAEEFEKEPTTEKLENIVGVVNYYNCSTPVRRFTLFLRLLQSNY